MLGPLSPQGLFVANKRYTLALLGRKKKIFKKDIRQSRNMLKGQRNRLEAKLSFGNQASEPHCRTGMITNWPAILLLPVPWGPGP